MLKEISGLVSLQTNSTTNTTISAGTTFLNQLFVGVVIGVYNTTLSQCSYWCQSQYISGCVGWSFNNITNVCQFFNSVGSVLPSNNRKLFFLIKLKSYSFCIKVKYFKEISGLISSQTNSTTNTTIPPGATLLNQVFVGVVIGVYNTTESQCSYWCSNQYVSNCIAYSYNVNTGTCQFFSQVTGVAAAVGRKSI